MMVTYGGVRMTIEILGKGTILVSLCAEDMRAYSLSFDEESDPKDGLKKLLYHIGDSCGLDHKGKSYLIEALPSKSGCLLIITVRKAKYRRKFRIKRRQLLDLYIFFDSDAMLDYIQRYPYESGYSIYRYQSRYILIPSRSSAPRELLEYAERRPVSAAMLAHIREFGRLLWEKELQRRHVGGRTVAVRDAASRNSGG